MNCPFCNYEETKVIDSRASEDNTTIRRRRECLKCSARFTTYERIESEPLVVIKKDGTRERFNRRKILNGLIKACEKREVSIEALNALISEVENKIRRQGNTEVKTIDIGELIMDVLKKIDQVAYVRFASVYKDFRDIDQFKKIIDELH